MCQINEINIFKLIGMAADALLSLTVSLFMRKVSLHFPNCIQSRVASYADNVVVHIMLPSNGLIQFLGELSLREKIVGWSAAYSLQRGHHFTKVALYLEK